MTTKSPPDISPPDIDPELAYLYDENGVFYPEADGEPMPDAEYQDHTIRSARYQLDHHFRRRPGSYVSGNTLIYYEQGNPRRSVSPDCYVAFDVDYSIIRYRDCYRVWDMGKPPDFVMEVASKSTYGNDTGEKMRIYAGIGIAEYWLFDKTPNGQYYGFRLAGYRLVNGQYQPLAVVADAAGNLHGYSPTLGLDIRWEYDSFWEEGEGKIRFYDPLAEAYLLDYEESLFAIDEATAAQQHAEAGRQQAEAGRQQAEAGRQQAEAALQESQAARAAAEAEAAALRAQLRRMQQQQPPPLPQSEPAPEP